MAYAYAEESIAEDNNDNPRQRRGFGQGSNGFQNSFRDKNLINWNSVFSKRLAVKRGLGHYNDGAIGMLDNPNLVNWNSRFNKQNKKRQFGEHGDAFGMPESSQYTNWQGLFNKRMLGRSENDALGMPSDEHFVDWNSLYAKRSRSRRSLSAEQPQAFGMPDSKFVDWNTMFAKKRFGHIGGFGMPDNAEYVNWNSLYAKRGFGNNGFQLGEGGSPNSLAFHDWRSTFARNSRAWDDNKLHGFGKVTNGMVNWQALIKRENEAKDNVDEKNDVEKAKE